MARKLSLPIKKEKPTLETARRKLGGSAEEEGGGAARGFAAGDAVAIPGGEGVVVFAGANELHVMLDETRLRKVRHGDASPSEVPAQLARIAADARVFGLLAKGQAVRYADEGGALRAGKLFEKCRYGGLVARDDGSVVAVGFRKLWPGPAAGEA